MNALALFLYIASSAQAQGPAAGWSQKNNSWVRASSTTISGPSRPRLVSSATFEEATQPTAPSMGADGSLYFVTNSSAVALNPDLSVRWTRSLGTAEGRTPAITADGQVWISSYNTNGDEMVIALSSANGQVLNDGGKIVLGARRSSPLLGPNGYLYYGATDPELNGSTNKIWRFNLTTMTTEFYVIPDPFGITTNGQLTSYALSPDGSVIYVTDDDNLYAVDALSVQALTSIWATPLEASHKAHGISVTKDGVILVLQTPNTGSSLNKLAAYETNGTQRWVKSVPYAGQQAPATDGTRVYVATATGNLFGAGHYINALSVADGSTVWSVQASTPILNKLNVNGAGWTVGPLTVANNRVYYGGTNIPLLPSGSQLLSAYFALNAANGQAVMTLPLPANSNISDMSVNAGRLIFRDPTHVYVYEESNAASFTLTVSTRTLAPGQSATFTAALKTAGLAGISNVGAIFTLESGTATPNVTFGLTDSAGEMAVTFSTTSLNSSTQESTFSVRVEALDFGVVETPVFVEGETIDHFNLQVPTSTAIGVPFDMKVFARNRYDHGLPTFPGTSGPAGVTLAPYLAGSSVAASGSLGSTVVGISNGTGTVTAQTYNKIEDISIKAAQTFPGTAFGYSNNIVVSGPSRFALSMPSAASAGSNFPVTVTALDGGGNVVHGYTGTLSFSALTSTTPTPTAGTGVLGVTNANMSASGSLTINQTYSKGETIYLKAADSAIGTVGFSTNTVVVTQPASNISHYSVSVATKVTVGLSFPLQINALDSSSAPVSYSSLDTPLTLSAVLSGTSIAGSGSLGAGSASLVAGSTYVIVGAQSYNRIETIQLKIVDANGRTGLSNAVVIGGPTTFTVTVPTYTVAAGENFRVTVQAKDGGGNLVTGYSGTVNVLAVTAADPNTGATGSLGVTSLAMSGGVANTDFQTYSKGDGLRIKILDPILNVSAVSSSFTVTAPTDLTNHYVVTVPTQVTVGLTFSASVQSLNTSSATVTYALGKVITLQAFLDGSTVGGSGSLGTSLLTLTAGQHTAATASQTYNKIETIRIRATDEFGRTGLSGPLFINGPSSFVVTLPTSSIRSGTPFTFAVEARDTGGNRVLGYNNAVAVTPFLATSTTSVGSGILGVSAMTFSSGAVSVSQTYTRAETVRFRVLDTALGLSTFSISSANFAPDFPTSLVLEANPGSVILGQTSALTATLQDQYGNKLGGSSITFTTSIGSGTLASSPSGLTSNLTSTTTLTGLDGKATATFGLPSGLDRAQRNVIFADYNSPDPLHASATIYVSVLIPTAGGIAVQSEDPRTAVTVPANAYAFNVNVDIVSRTEFDATIEAKTAAAIAKGPAQFVPGLAKRISALRENSSTDAGEAAKFIDLQLPYDTVGSTSVTVASMGLQPAMVRIQNVLVPASVLRVYKLNEATSVFEQVQDGNLVDTTAKVVRGRLKKLSGVYTLGAPPSQEVSGGQSASLTNSLGNGATVQVDVPAGCFADGTRVTVDPAATSTLPPVTEGGVAFKATGLALNVDAAGLQPSKTVKLVITYTPANVAGFDERLLRMARFDTTLNNWVLIDSQVDTQTRRVIGFTKHFSLFQVMQIAPQSTLSAAMAYPSPFRPAAGHTKITFGSLTAGAVIRVFTVNGRFLRKLTADATGAADWDVKDEDGSKVASGVYLAFVEGTSDKKTLKFAVQR